MLQMVKSAFSNGHVYNTVIPPFAWDVLYNYYTTAATYDIQHDIYETYPQ